MASCYIRLTVEETGIVGAIEGLVVTVDDSGAVPPVNSSVIAPNTETPPTGGFPFGLCTSNNINT